VWATGLGAEKSGERGRAGLGALGERFFYRLVPGGECSRGGGFWWGGGGFGCG